MQQTQACADQRAPQARWRQPARERRQSRNGGGEEQPAAEEPLPQHGAAHTAPHEAQQRRQQRGAVDAVGAGDGHAASRAAIVREQRNVQQSLRGRLHAHLEKNVMFNNCCAGGCMPRKGFQQPTSSLLVDVKSTTQTLSDRKMESCNVGGQCI